MRKLITVFILVAIFLIAAAPVNGAMTVNTLDDTETVDGLINTLLGSGVTITNVSYIGADVSSGTYTTTGSSVINIPTGVILTSGNAHLAENTTNTSDSAGQNVGGAGDADLTSLLGPTYFTQDATILEFDFELIGGDGTGSVFINYVWASEEYNEWVNSPYNDVFGFFVNKVGEAATNIALVPMTTDPVAIDTVNNSVNSAYYHDNDPGIGGDTATTTPVAIEYDGFTDVFTASYDILTAGTYHMKIGVADAGDPIYDSAVFIQGGSFSNEPEPIVPVPGAFLLGMLGLSVAGVKLRKHA